MKTRSVDATATGVLAAWGASDGSITVSGPTTKLPLVDPRSVMVQVLVTGSWVSSACRREMP